MRINQIVKFVLSTLGLVVILYALLLIYYNISSKYVILGPTRVAMYDFKGTVTIKGRVYDLNTERLLGGVIIKGVTDGNNEASSVVENVISDSNGLFRLKAKTAWDVTVSNPLPFPIGVRKTGKVNIRLLFERKDYKPKLEELGPLSIEDNIVIDIGSIGLSPI